MPNNEENPSEQKVSEEASEKASEIASEIDLLAIGLLLLSEQRPGGANYGKIRYAETLLTPRKSTKLRASKKKSNSKR